ncbi:MAG: HEAT repeat domain-containing protein, partial [Candidatus Sumerlaeota bacterium]
MPDSLLSSPHTQGLSHIADALEANRVQAATQQFNEMVEQSTDLLLLGSEIAEIMNALYDELLVEGMAGFIPWLRQFPVDEATDPVLRELNEPWELATDWQNDLRDLANERLARQIRKLVRDRDVSGATQLAIRFLLRGKPRGSQKQHRVRQLATILGTMGHDRTRAMKVADNICKQRNAGGLDSDDGSLLIDEMGKAQASLSLSEMGEYERQWNQMHTQCVVKLIRRLPGPGAENARPSPEDENRFYDSLHALLAAYYIDCGQDLESEASRERLQDVVRILKEFCPTDEREIGPVEGVEDVAFLRLGPGDRLVSVRSLRRLGEKERVVDTVLQSIHHRQKGRRSENLLYLMGGLANERFFPFLAAALRDKDHAPMHASIVDSLGRIGTEDALDVLSERFTRLTEKKVLESAQQRKVADCILALGRIARSPRTGSHVRDTIVSRVLDRLPDDRVLQRTAVQSLCSWNPGGLNDENKDKILKIAVDSLWSLDRASNLQ